MLEFKNKQQLMGYTSMMKDKLQNGEVVSLEKEKKVFTWKDNSWVEIKVNADSNIKLTMFELNEQIMKQQPAHTEEQLKEDIETINKFYDIDKSEFYMLLCKEQSYFTVLRKNNASERLGPTVIDLLIEIDHSILSVENLNDNEVEIWSKNKDNEIWCSHLFNYARGVVDFGG